MYYVWTCDAHELHGPFVYSTEANQFAHDADYIKVWCILHHSEVKAWMWNSWRKVA